MPCPEKDTRTHDLIQTGLHKSKSFFFYQQVFLQLSFKYNA